VQFLNEIWLNKNIINNWYADSSDFKAYVSWNYNWKILKAKSWSIDYILAVPSIILSDYTELKLEDIIDNANSKFVLNWYKNIPANYGMTNSDSWSLDFLKKDNFVVFEWDLDELSKSWSLQEELWTKLALAYSWTTIENNSGIKEIVNAHIWTPTTNNQAWQNSDSNNACYYQCSGWYTGNDCSTEPVLSYESHTCYNWTEAIAMWEKNNKKYWFCISPNIVYDLSWKTNTITTCSSELINWDWKDEKFLWNNWETYNAIKLKVWNTKNTYNKWWLYKYHTLTCDDKLCSDFSISWGIWGGIYTSPIKWYSICSISPWKENIDLEWLSIWPWWKYHWGWIWMFHDFRYLNFWLNWYYNSACYYNWTSFTTIDDNNHVWNTFKCNYWNNWFEYE